MTVISLHTVVMDVITIMCFHVLLSEGREISMGEEWWSNGEKTGNVLRAELELGLILMGQWVVLMLLAAMVQPYLENHSSTLRLRDKGEEEVYAGDISLQFCLHFTDCNSVV